MEWGRFSLVMIAASVAASLSDWLFMGVLFHEKYGAAPEIWRPSVGRQEGRRIIYSQVIGLLSCGAFAFLCVQANALTVGSSLVAAVLVWLAGPVVVIAQMVQWTKLHPLIGAAHTLGWLARFIVTGLLAAWWL